MDLSNAFEDGRACLEELGERRRRGRVSQEEEATVMESLKERFRAEYRKVGGGAQKVGRQRVKKYAIPKSYHSGCLSI